jgi:hypothetical protein
MTSAPIWRGQRRTDISVAIGKEHIMTNGTILTYQVYVAPIIAMAGKDVPPLVRLMEQRQLLDPFGFLVYPEQAGAELSPVR